MKKTSASEKLIALRSELVRDIDFPTMAAGLVHEVKNPLAAIHLHLQLLEGYIGDMQETDLKHKILGKVKTIKNEISSLNTTLQQFIHTVRTEQKERKSGPIDLNSIAREVVLLLEPQARKTNIALSFQPGIIEPIVMADPVMVKQVALNLILNAIQAFENSKLSRDNLEVIVSSGTINGAPYFRVKDNGPGIPLEKQEKIFEPFFTTRDDGSGLGLSLVKKMIGDQGGHVEINSEPGKGTEFTVYLSDPKLIAE